MNLTSGEDASEPFGTEMRVGVANRMQCHCVYRGSNVVEPGD